MKDKVSGSAVTRPSSPEGRGAADNVTHIHALQTGAADRAADQTQPVNEGHVGEWVTLRAQLGLLAFDHNRMRNQRGGGRIRQSTKAASACQQVVGQIPCSSLFFFFFRVHQSSNSPRLFKQLLSETLESLISVFVPLFRALAQKLFKGQRFSDSSVEQVVRGCRRRSAAAGGLGAVRRFMNERPMKSR